MMKHIDVSVAAERLHELISGLQPGQKVILTQVEQPVAELASFSAVGSPQQSLTVHLSEYDTLEELTLAIYCYKVRTAPAKVVRMIGGGLHDWLCQANRIDAARDVNQLLALKLSVSDLRRFLILAIGWCPHCGLPLNRRECQHAKDLLSFDGGQRARVLF